MYAISYEDLIRRHSLKGTSKNNEDLKLICDIRHQFTNYEKLVYFYSVFPKRRKELNSYIGKLIREGPDAIEDFKQKIKKLERKVNLNGKEGKEAFLKQEEKRLKREYPDLTPKQLREWALASRSQIIRLNNNYINKKRSRKNETETE